MRILRPILGAIALGALAMAIVIGTGRTSKAGLGASSLIANIGGVASASEILADTVNEFMLLDSTGGLVWRADSGDVHYDVNSAGEVEFTVDVPDGVVLQTGYEFVWRCDARELGTSALMLDFRWVDANDVTWNGHTPARPISGTIAESQVED